MTGQKVDESKINDTQGVIDTMESLKRSTAKIAMYPKEATWINNQRRPVDRRIRGKPLKETFPEVIQRLVDELRQSRKRLEPLDEICIQRCRGNPQKGCNGNPYTCQEEE